MFLLLLLLLPLLPLRPGQLMIQERSFLDERKIRLVWLDQAYCSFVVVSKLQPFSLLYSIENGITFVRMF